MLNKHRPSFCHLQINLHVKLKKTHTHTHARTQNTKLPSVVLARDITEEVSGMQAAQHLPRDCNVAVTV